MALNRTGEVVLGSVADATMRRVCECFLPAGSADEFRGCQKKSVGGRTAATRRKVGNIVLSAATIECQNSNST